MPWTQNILNSRVDAHFGTNQCVQLLLPFNPQFVLAWCHIAYPFVMTCLSRVSFALKYGTTNSNKILTLKICTNSPWDIVALNEVVILVQMKLP